MPDYTDPKQGGDLSDMAATGATMPNDAGDLRMLKSVPRPDQLGQGNDLGNDTLAGAADNASDIPRSTRDQALNTEIITGTGDAMPAHTDSKRLYETTGGTINNPAAKGHPRDEKAHRQEDADQELGVSDGPSVQEIVGMEASNQEDLCDRVDYKS